MQSLLGASISNADQVTANELVDTVPLVMRVIRKHFRRHRSGLSIAQFRTLWFVSTDAHQSLSAVAEFIGLSLPAMSRMVDGLVAKEFIERRSCEKDRRHVRLSITEKGESAVREARSIAQNHVAEVLTQLSSEQQNSVRAAMEILRSVFTPEASSVDPGGIERLGVEKDCD